jgi:release factor glutamine methyltransferase
MTVKEAVEETTRRLGNAGVPGPGVDARALVSHVTRLSLAGLVLDRTRHLTSLEEESLERLVRRRQRREPLQWLVGVDFLGLPLKAAPGVLVPRPETERLVELVLPALPRGAQVVDVGVGSGAIALALKQARPDLKVTATDISAAAVALTRENAEASGIELTVQQGDLLAGVEGQVDAVVSNPPYLPVADAAVVDEEVRLDPPEALYAGHDGLAVARRLVVEAAVVLRAGGLLALELDPRNVRVLARELDPGAWKDVRVEADLVGRERFLLASRV